MPELAELKLTADYINRVSSGKVFSDIWKNPVHKGKGVLVTFPFTVQAKSRGKELMLELCIAEDFATEENNECLHLMMTMGMAGHFQWSERNNRPKHTHLSFVCEDGELCFVDVRRFGRWNFGYWNPERGPDPTVNFKAFKLFILSNLHKKDFDKPIHEALMNQKFFNGIGNYLRAEILYRLDIDPFSKARDVINNNSAILDLCREIPSIAYELGGGRLRDWKNPDGELANQKWEDFMKCYGRKNMNKITDSNGRTFWFDPKWTNTI
jgi:endonuclease VIII-like 1